MLSQHHFISVQVHRFIAICFNQCWQSTRRVLCTSEFTLLDAGFWRLVIIFRAGNLRSIINIDMTYICHRYCSRQRPRHREDQHIDVLIIRSISATRWLLPLAAEINRRLQRLWITATMAFINRPLSHHARSGYIAVFKHKGNVNGGRRFLQPPITQGNGTPEPLSTTTLVLP